MRQILSLSLPQQTTKEIKKNAATRGFSSVSAYVNYLFDMDKNLISEIALLQSIKEARKEYRQGKTVTAKSLADLI